MDLEAAVEVSALGAVSEEKGELLCIHIPRFKDESREVS